MAGHSKWANIQYRKNEQDSKRGKIFTKLLREITMAARQSGNEPSSEPRLRAAIDKALSHNMARDTIDKAIKRSIGAKNAANAEELTYEGYGPHGVALLVSCITDNRNRTASEVRAAFRKHGGSLGADGSVAYLFIKKGQLNYVLDPTDEEKLLESALEVGADDIVTHDDGSIGIMAAPNNFDRVKTSLAQVGFKAAYAEITMIATSHVTIIDKQAVENITDLVAALEDLDDVQDVYTNAHCNF